MRAIFYDIESLGDAFTLCSYDADEISQNGQKGVLNVFYLCDNIIGVSDIVKNDPANPSQNSPEYIAMGKYVAEKIRERNKNFSGAIKFWNLGSADNAERNQANWTLAKIFGASDAGSALAYEWANARRPISGPNSQITDANIRVADQINDPRCASTFGPDCRITCDTDIKGTYINQAGEVVETKDFDKESMPYIMGFNSQNYDTTMLALYLDEASNAPELSGGADLVWKRIDAATMRTYNDALFADDIRNNMYSALSRDWDAKTNRFSDHAAPRRDGKRRPDAIRKNMINSGRHLDVSRLNEKQYKQGLKRLLGFLGLQILESDKLRDAQKLENLENFAELIAYNVSDVVNLRELFLHPAYYTAFENKRGLMETYPDVVYDRKPRSYEPNISPYFVRPYGRLLPDSKSAQFATKILCPWDHLHDIEAVSFMYPSENIAKKLGIKQYNVLDDCKDFIFDNVGEDSELWREFKHVYDYYKRIEGKNFNSSNNYTNDYGSNVCSPLVPYDIHGDQIEKDVSCVRYWLDKDTPTSCYVNFSVGGIHGAEYNLRGFQKAHAAWEKDAALINAAKELFDGDAIACRKARKFEIEGVEHEFKEVLKGGRTIPNSEWKDIDALEPQIFVSKKDDPSTKLNPKWTYTSADFSNHEDFSSYYPNLLRQMEAFVNEQLVKLGTDRYADIYDKKQNYGKLEKDQSLTLEERQRYHLIREGTKLILNAATGAADTNKYPSPIQLNNRIISMRIIGQLLSWRIGQAQAFEGAKVISTNTDGLYTVMDEEENNKILDEQSKNIGVAIDPEPMFLISKDTNNRLELDAKTRKIKIANGGTLAHYRGVDMSKSLAHAPILDWLCAQYLVCVTDPNRPAGTPSIEDEFDKDLARILLEKARGEMSELELLKMYATIVASNPSSNTYVFGTEEEDAHIGEPIVLQHYNRAFFLKNPTEKTMHLHAAHPRKITPAVQAKREREIATAMADPTLNPPKRIQDDETAIKVLEANGITRQTIRDLAVAEDKPMEAAIHQMSGIDESFNVLIENHALSELDEAEVKAILDNLNLDAYIDSMADTFEKAWRNHV